MMLVFALCACEENIDISGQYEEKLVLNGIAKVNEPVTIQLSKTRNILDSDDQIDWVRNADVYLTCNGNTYEELMTYDSLGVYRSTHIAKYGETFSVEILHPKYENVSAEAAMPELSIANVTLINSNFENEDIALELKIDNRNDDDFYIWEMLYRAENQAADKNINIVSTDLKADNILPDQSHDRNRIFIKGSEAEGNSIFSSFTADIEESDLNNAELRLITVNGDMYNYFKSLELYRNSTATFVEPIEIYSNVNNGLGIFGAISETVILVER